METIKLPTITFPVTAAVAVIPADIMLEEFATSARPRVVSRIGVVGSAAIADTGLDLYYGSTKIGSFKNTTAGAAKVPLRDDMQIVNSPYGCDPNERIRLVVTDNADTQIVMIKMEITEY